MDATSVHIDLHIRKITGQITSHEEDPNWIPPPWYDLKSIKNPEVRERWMAPDGKEIDGITDSDCYEETLVKDLTLQQRKRIIGCLTLIS